MLVKDSRREAVGNHCTALFNISSRFTDKQFIVSNLNNVEVKADFGNFLHLYIAILFTWVKVRIHKFCWRIS
jgi:hypothetical protein